jgi:hypothetical protein
MNTQELKTAMKSRGHLLSDTERQVVCLYVYHGMSFNDIREIVRPGPFGTYLVYKKAVSKLTKRGHSRDWSVQTWEIRDARRKHLLKLSEAELRTMMDPFFIEGAEVTWPVLIEHALDMNIGSHFDLPGWPEV